MCLLLYCQSTCPSCEGRRPALCFRGWPLKSKEAKCNENYPEERRARSRVEYLLFWHHQEAVLLPDVVSPAEIQKRGPSLVGEVEEYP